MIATISNRIRHFFHVVSNVRPIIWICLYILLVPVFALIYHWLPDGQFRIPGDAGVDYGSWLYYSIVTITTLGFGDYTPAHGWAQAVTAIEVMCGLAVMGFFLNAVGSMKSEIDVDAEIEKQRRLHADQERTKLLQTIPVVLHNLNRFVEKCTSALAATDASRQVIADVLRLGSRTALCIDSMQNRIDLSLWPDLLEKCFGFVADYQMYSAEDPTAESEGLKTFLTQARDLALDIETTLTQISRSDTAVPA
ncbi:MAG: two pore domain potassium channel family protein [Muribaculaceae bacterium]|nr:two pore domain potassium channel family protein [Muribaculaceae bacterium]